MTERFEVAYSQTHWSNFSNMRDKAGQIVNSLGELKRSAIVHGSLARGDVDNESDIDILIQNEVSTQLVESSLESHGFQSYLREVAQATPMHSPKAHIYLDSEQKMAVTIPIRPLRSLEAEFYRFGGIVGSKELIDHTRVPGCTKRLTLIEPTEHGHVESSIIGREAQTANILGISVKIVEERIRVLERRDKVGRTGIFLRIPVPDEMSFEEVLAREARENPALRRTLRVRDS
jgi:predicted nucleotidyltransferase